LDCNNLHMKKILFLSFLFLSFSAHKFYVSVNEIKYNNDSGKLEISSRLFIDDMETAIPNLKIAGDNDSLANTLIGPYLMENMAIKINNKNTTLNYLGYEIEQDVIWCFVESDKTKKPNTVDLSFEMLIREFEDQTNIVHFEMDQEIKSVFIKHNNVNQTLDFRSKKD